MIPGVNEHFYRALTLVQEMRLEVRRKRMTFYLDAGGIVSFLCVLDDPSYLDPT